uniref:F-box domain-containing protein n=1 Tax=Oryza punctata TaxID=4537 RepID=A0A0E0KNM1_ORYPU
MQRKPSGGGMCDLPTDCVARIASLTSPGDACRLASAAAALRPVADSDDVWGSFLPPEWAGTGEALDGESARRERESKKEMFLRLCDSPVLLDGGKLRSGAKKYMMPARALSFGWSGYPYGGLVWIQNHPDSRFSEVAVLSHLCWLDIYGIFNTKHLSNGTSYAAYIVYNVQFLHTEDQNAGDKEQDAAASGSSSTSSICSHECNHLVPHKHLRSPLFDMDYDGSSFVKTNYNKKKELKYGGIICVRSDGWMEQEISTEISMVKENNKENGDISIEFMGLTGSHQCQIIVEGIEIRPKN